MLEDVFDLQSLRSHGFDEFSRVDAVFSGTIIGDRAGGRGIGYEGPAGSVDGSQALSARAKAAGKGIVAAGIEDHDIEAVAGVVHLRQHHADVNGFIFDLFFVFDLSPDGDEVVPSIDLHPVAGVVEEADAALEEPLAKGLDVLFHLFLAEVHLFDHVEPQASKERAHGQRIVWRIAQGDGFVGAVADHQGDPLLGLAGRGRAGRQFQAAVIGADPVGKQETGEP